MTADQPLTERHAVDKISAATWLGSTAAVALVFSLMAVAFFDGSLDERVLRQARPGVASMTVADTVFDGPLIEGRSAEACNKEAVRNLTVALIDSGQFGKAAEELKEVGGRCASFR